MVLLEMVRHWMLEFPKDDLIIASRHPRRDEISPVKPPLGPAVVPTKLQLHPLVNFFELPYIARREQVDATLAFNFATSARSSVVFIHDVLFQTNPEWFTRPERLYYSLMPKMARRAKSVVATSASERRRISTANPSLARVVQSGLAVSGALRDSESVPPNLNLEPNSFILCVGRFNIRKNLAATIDGVLYSGYVSTDRPLVIVGEPSGLPTDLETYQAWVREGSIVVAKYVTDGQLKWLYSNCKLFVCLALDEGFGLPVVEAASFGAPVLASDIAVFRETLGAYGHFVNPVSVQEIADATRRILEKDEQPSVDFVEKYSWSEICRIIRRELAIRV